MMVNHEMLIDFGLSDFQTSYLKDLGWISRSVARGWPWNAVDLSALAQSSDKAQLSQVVPSGNHRWQFWEWKKQLFLDDLPYFSPISKWWFTNTWLDIHIIHFLDTWSVAQVTEHRSDGAVLGYLFYRFHHRFIGADVRAVAGKMLAVHGCGMLFKTGGATKRVTFSPPEPWIWDVGHRAFPNLSCSFRYQGAIMILCPAPPIMDQSSITVVKVLPFSTMSYRGRIVQNGQTLPFSSKLGGKLQESRNRIPCVAVQSKYLIYII